MWYCISGSISLLLRGTYLWWKGRDGSYGGGDLEELFPAADAFPLSYPSAPCTGALSRVVSRAVCPSPRNLQD